jgi:hypothetical protein
VATEWPPLKPNGTSVRVNWSAAFWAGETTWEVAEHAQKE